jgi:hypothetical protein
MNILQLIQKRPAWVGRYLAVILVGLVLLLLTAGSAATQTFPTIRIINVIPNQSVTIDALNLPPDREWVVRMGTVDAEGIGGTVVATAHSGPAGTFQGTYQIPQNLHGAAQIVIRLESPSGWFAYHWFENLPTGIPVQAPVPSFLITEVAVNHSVTIAATNFPPNQQFRVTMGQLGSEGIGGIAVATTNSGEAGAFTETYNIPAELHGREQIAVRLESPIGIFAHNWFFNAPFVARPGIGGPVIPALTAPTFFTGIPAIRIVHLAPGQSVTIKTDNFPPNQEFVVRMGHADTLGIGGTVITSTYSGAGGVFQATYPIPADLRSLDRLAIRLESPQGFFAYFWFENVAWLSH